ncbi:MAG: 16S rRNA (cytosine(1402)-N(4))-methyltransferase RsmH [Anaerolineae bacterium]|nr:16S rRNA (cytosine(1402)-N(4))-methyltransferase RsmH [Anaerolineae bacterium]
MPSDTDALPRAHVSVLFDQVLAALAPRPDGCYIDATLGAGGHAAGILDASSPSGRLLGIDADPHALEIARQVLERFGTRVRLVHANFENLYAVAASCGFVPADGIVLDLGLSSMQLSDAQRGFSFQSEGALDMRFDPNTPTTAADLVNTLDERALADLIFEYGEERAARRIARAIVRARPIHTARQLADVIARAVGRQGKLHPATRTFQALRIAVNRELKVLERVLPQVVQVLKPGGRVAIIAFHSLEDRRVKNFFRTARELRVLTKHPITPTPEEIAANPRSRSAKLRVAEKVL